MSFEKLIVKLKKDIEKEATVLFDKKIMEASELDPFIKRSYISLKNFALDGGKRLRPIALIMAYKGVGGKNIHEITRASFCVELLHASTLIHDDLMDEDDTRRNKPTIHKQLKSHYLHENNDGKYDGPLFKELSARFCVSNAILFGNILQTMGASCLTDSSFDTTFVNRALEAYNNAYRHVNEGQMLDIQLELKKPTEKKYYDMIKRKTGNLFVASVEIGALLGNANKKQQEMLKNYAESFAVAFQLKDDLLDIIPGKGRPIGSDIKKGKKTLLILKALEKAKKEQKDVISSILGKEDATDEEIIRMAEILRSTGAYNYVEKIAEEKIKEAKKFISNAGLSREATDFFISFSEYIVNRKS